MMDDTKNKNTKPGNQAWRKKPRKFSSKSKLGCKTCKIRRIKCDQSRPSCVKCVSTGRTCDGYSEMPLAFRVEKPEVESTHPHKEINRADSSDSCYSCTTISAHESEQWHSKSNGLTSQNLGSLMILPVTGTQADIMCFFQDISIKHLNEYRPCELWRQTLMFFAQTVPSVRHAAMALALMHQIYLDRHSNNQVYLPDKAPLLHYNRAIQLLLNPEAGDSAETRVVTLLVCYLFTCFDHLAGDNVQALKHLRGGVALSHNIDSATLNSCHNQSPGVHAIICQVAKQIRRLDMQAGMFLVDWTPANIQDTFMPFDSTFQSLDQAADHLQVLVAQVMRMRNTDQQMSLMGTMPPLHSAHNDNILRQLETWLGLFENLLQQGSPSESDLLVSLLRLQHTIAWILLNDYGPGREMEYDNLLPLFQQCVALAGEVSAAHQRYSGSSKPTFTPEIGLIPILYIIGVKCRHPTVRREVLSILRWQVIREGAWDSITTARVVQRVIEIEEAAAGEEHMVQCMEQIPIWQRVEALSYTHIPRGPCETGLEITYTFCAQEGIHLELLTI
ncbi:sugar transporter [Aspergillus sclerotioniger CBS 115572]|uniref:Sugar transporter n=1 Tax=Aspergillus sclerotioniger CBS 115572 TaxID=1450535 RepID=A0A317WDT4_9EURO|nr:sugar transporter [Aspergillus sclerotioniger CBS 115572]PWY83901.1 sugar transporter [Aspergillus sclerotioniger CBS 115572]